MNLFSNSLKFAVTCLLVAYSLSARAETPKESSLPNPDVLEVLPGASRPGSDPLQLIQAEQVQKELELSDNQIEQLQQIDQQVRSQLNQRSRGIDTSQDMEKEVQDARQQVAGVLQPDQLERFREILLQVNGWAPEPPPSRSRGLNFQNPIQLNSEQQQELTDLQKEMQQSMRSSFSRSRSSDPEAICRTVNDNREKIEPIRQAIQQQALEALTEEQQATLEELKGEPFALEPPDCRP
jgi:hypothetical protein